ncbi:glycosyltransferase [Leptolyngbya sp. 'hensonii']|uniref:glycosyltransferase family 9 protein n=1 Tax=Leptolyngbya sp. 'hensonii' TaxID=1922337 RepID=UPI00094FD5B7|nr:glycosyltransferase family 9 protein [Leptolyngbya sp. 'hensonii']OLP17721.1 glycosyltransferase [Leptolyngbya sp. 'hensonii']
MRILALVPGGIGDQILFFPALDTLKRVYPEAQIDVVVEPRAKEAYRVSKAVRDTILFDFGGNNSLADWGNLLGVIRDREYDVAFSVRPSWGVGLLLWLTGIPTRIGYAGVSTGFLTHPVAQKTEQYTAAMYYDLLQGLGIHEACPEVSISLPRKDIEWAEAEQKRLGLQGGGYVLIHGSSHQAATSAEQEKTYPIKSWVKIIQDFRQKQPDLPIVLLRGLEPPDLVDDLMEVSLKPAPLVTRPGELGKLAAMIAGSSLMLCTESTAMNLAVALQAFTLTIFGPTDPAKLLPVSDRFLGLQSSTGKAADIPPEKVLEKIWGG